MLEVVLNDCVIETNDTAWWSNNSTSLAKSASERVRDKIAASKRKGIWVGGPVPLGYRVAEKKVVAIPEEAVTVRTIFTRYLELGSIGALIEDLDRRGIRTKTTRLVGDRVRGGIRFGTGSLAHLLKKPLLHWRSRLSRRDPSRGTSGDHRAGAVRGRAGQAR